MILIKHDKSLLIVIVTCGFPREQEVEATGKVSGFKVNNVGRNQFFLSKFVTSSFVTQQRSMI